MITALSRFKVLNHQLLVQHSQGFLGVEAFTDGTDASVFYLSTRWTTESVFRQLHSNDAYQAAHKGIPKGIKLYAGNTQLVVLKDLCD